MLVVATGNRQCKSFDLSSGMREINTIESPLKYQVRLGTKNSISQSSCVSIFKSKTDNQPCGYARASPAIQYRTRSTGTSTATTSQAHLSSKLRFVRGYF